MSLFNKIVLQFRKGFIWCLESFCLILLLSLLTMEKAGRMIEFFCELIIHIVTNFLFPFWANFALQMTFILIEYVIEPLILWFIAPILGWFFDLFLRLCLRLGEVLCFTFYFLWEICGWKFYKRSLFGWLYLFFVGLLWGSYVLLLFMIYDGTWVCCLEKGASRCGPLFFLLSYSTFFFLELRRALKRWLLQR